MRCQSSDIRSTGGGFGMLRVASSLIASLAREIIAGGGMALRRPTLRAPVIDHAGLPNERLETLRFPHAGVGFVPKQRSVRWAETARRHPCFVIVEDAKWIPHIY